MWKVTSDFSRRVVEFTSIYWPKTEESRCSNESLNPQRAHPVRTVTSENQPQPHVLNMFIELCTKNNSCESRNDSFLGHEGPALS